MAIDKFNTADWGTVASVSGVASGTIDNIGGFEATVTLTYGGTPVISDITASWSSGSNSNAKVFWDTTNAVAVNLPSTRSSGDFMMMVITSENDLTIAHETNPTSPNQETEQTGATVSGWTCMNSEHGVTHNNGRWHWGDSNSDADIYVFYRVCNGTESSTINTYGIQTNGYEGGGEGEKTFVMAQTFILSNIDTSNPTFNVGNWLGAGSQIGWQNPHHVDAPSVTSTSAGLLLCLCAFDGGDHSSSTPSYCSFTMTNSNFTLTNGYNYNASYNSGAGISMGMKYAAIGENTASGDTYMKQTDNLRDGIVGVQIVVHGAYS